MLTHWKFYLRAVTNAIIDVRIHAGEAFGGPMTEDEAVELMVDGGFQEEAEARNKWNRARLSSTQLSTYFVGSMAMWELEVDGPATAGRGGRGTAAAAAVVERALPGRPRRDAGLRLAARTSRRSCSTARCRCRSSAGSSSTRAEAGQPAAGTAGVPGRGFRRRSRPPPRRPDGPGA